MLGPYGIPIGVAAGIATTALVWGMVEKAYRERQKMEKEMATMEAEMSRMRVEAGSVAAAIPETAIAQEGGRVTKEGFAYVHKDEDIIPPDGARGINVNIFMDNAIVTNDSAQMFAEKIERAFIKSLKTQRRLR